MNPKHFKAIRENLNLTQEKLADELGVTRFHIGQLESGKAPIQKQTAMALKYLTDVTLKMNVTYLDGLIAQSNHSL